MAEAKGAAPWGKDRKGDSNKLDNSNQMKNRPKTMIIIDLGRTVVI
ncbi:MAG: hypothetical protein IPI60_16975 [Saprospiraceae bacterium]|nr:hypothetical protein [Saprospiraceae bacterium]